MYITGLNNERIEVTDLPKAIDQARHCVEMHEHRKSEIESGEKVLYFPEAHKMWNHYLEELHKLNQESNV